MANPLLSGTERTFDKSDIIVSKTDAKGIITYANDIFLTIADYQEHEVLGKPHKVIRHPAMPKCIFKLLWETIASSNEIFAYVVNRTKYGDYYWVFAHVTPTYGKNREIVEYHSNRRVPNPEAIKIIQPLYQHLKAIEDSQSNAKDGMEKAYKALFDLLAAHDTRYDKFMYALQQLKTSPNAFTDMVGGLNV